MSSQQPAEPAQSPTPANVQAPQQKPTPTPQPAAKPASQQPAASVPALLLTLGGAPATWHLVEGVYVHPDVPSPVGEMGEPTVEKAEALAAADGCRVKLVEITAAEAADARAARAAARGEGLHGAREAARQANADRRRAHPSDVDRIQTEAAAAAGGE
jgi:hypothetical protein